MVSSVSSNSSMVNQLFAKLDTKKQGYLELGDLQSAYSAISGSDSSSASAVFTALDGDSDGKVTASEFSSTLSKLQESLDGQFNQMRMQGMGGHGPQGMAGMPPPPPPKNDSGFTQDELQSQLDDIGASDSQRSSLISNIVDNFSAADADGDGKVTFQEARAFDESSSGSSSSATGASSTATAADASSDSITDQLASLIAGLGGMPPPPPPPQNDAGFTQDELQSQLEAIGSSDSQRSSLISNIVSNFAAADSDGDGKVNFQEARTYDESSKAGSASTSGSATSTGAASGNDDLKLMQKILQLMHAYGAGSDNSASSLATSA